MMRRHVFSRPTSYTHQLGTAAGVVAALIYVGLFLLVMRAITPSFLHWS